ncbi:MAG: hypothetical protein L3J51_01660 [Cocleimonas sp.]|nr:hypothetical protein [Cocleimonas sp.]
MKTIASLSFLILISLFSFDAIATGLQDYLQNTPAVTAAEAPQTGTPSELLATTAETVKSNSPLTYIIELVVAGIVASALIISVLVLFLGRWAANREKKLIKELRIEAEAEKDHVISAAASIREKEEETSELVKDMQDKANRLTSKIDLADKHNEKILEVTEKVIKHEKELKEVSDHVSIRMNDIQDYWNDQLHETISVIGKVQSGLDENLAKVDDGIETMQRQKELSQDLLQDFLSKHKEQEEVVSNSSNISEQVTKSLEETLEESNKLLELLKQHQKVAEKSLQGFSNELTVYEEQAYEQFDSTFQVADLARQELTANIDESRKHIETMRRHEEQSHNINTQTQKNLELLDYSKIMKLSTTLDSTHDMFTDIRSRVDETKHMLDELKDIETDIKERSEGIGNTEDSTDTNDAETTNDSRDTHLEQQTEEEKESNTIFDTEYKMASGDFTPLSFFKNIKSSSNK